MKLPLVYFGQPILRSVAKTVTVFDADLKKLSHDMVDTMVCADGIGLAGPQINVEKRIFVMQIPPQMDVDEAGNPENPMLPVPVTMVNPEILASSEEEEDYEEGCLSIPGVNGNVRRPVGIQVNYQDVEGAEHTLELVGMAARCAQHEMDHLDGKLFIDYLSHVKKMAIAGRLKRIKAGKI